MAVPDHGKNLIIYIPISAILGFIILTILCKVCRKKPVRDIQPVAAEVSNAFDYNDLLVDKEDQRLLKS